VSPTANTTKFFDCYKGVELPRLPLPPSPPPPTTPKGYVLFASANAYAGHGGNPIDDQPASVHSVDECATRCNADDRCGCVTYQVASSTNQVQCWKREQCVAYQFESSPGYDVLVNLQRTPMNLPTPPAKDAIALGFTIEAEGFGCVVEAETIEEARHARPAAAAAVSTPKGVEARAANGSLSDFLAEMAAMTRTPLAAYAKAWTYLPQVMVDLGKTVTPTEPPEGMVYVPKAMFSYECRGIEIEGDDEHGVDVQMPWEARPQRNHAKNMTVGPFYMDRAPVTNVRYFAYLGATGYAPSDRRFWLAQWNGSASPPAHLEAMPVTYVSLQEARLFCSWAGGRLPHTWEWQYAAQGTDGRLYPWGSDKNKEGALPTFNTGQKCPGPEKVGVHSPAGDSPFGLQDMVGNVWQYTDEFYDEHTRAVLLRGGSNYRPSGSTWYFPNQPELNTHNKYFLMSDSYERAGTIGFRCLADA